MVFELNYRKVKDTKELHSSLENSKLELQATQNYVPIYKRFFNLNESNYNNIALNSKWLVKSVTDDSNKKLFDCVVVGSSNVETNKETFIKCSPLLDPLKFMLGKYDTDGKELLPKTLEYNDFHKIKDVNNSAYTDSFFVSNQQTPRRTWIHSWFRFLWKLSGSTKEFYIRCKG